MNSIYPTKLRPIRSAICLALVLLSPLAFAQSIAPEQELALEISIGGDDFRTHEVRKYFERMQRQFEIYRITMPSPEDASYSAGTRDYYLDREHAGNFRYNSLKVSSAVFYKAIATSVESHFLPMNDTVNNDDSGVIGIELLQMMFRQAKALGRDSADLDSVDQRVTVTYVYDGKHLVIAPTTFNFVDNAVNTKGTGLHSKLGVNSFSKHYMLALILNEQAEVTMAGKIYVRIRTREPGNPVDLESVFSANGEVNLAEYEFDLTVSNESGTFKPASEGLLPFAQVLVDGLGLSHISYRGHASTGQEPLTGDVYPSATD
jgi:hypothetical protein